MSVLVRTSKGIVVVKDNVIVHAFRRTDLVAVADVSGGSGLLNGFPYQAVDGQWSYDFRCAHCSTHFETRRWWRIVLACRTHRFVCRANIGLLNFPGHINDLP